MATNQGITLWYGDDQSFGELGQAQSWINILGNVSIPNLNRLEYRLNEAKPVLLSFGSDKHRLAQAGDFNIELSWETVFDGVNMIQLSAHDQAGKVSTKTMQFRVTKNRQWPLPYQVDFAKIDKLQQVVQVIDGHWDLTDQGVRTVFPYYDRVICMGDTSWYNYETTVELTIHNWAASAPGPPTYNVTHFGQALRWRGHHDDDNQPRRKWYPLGAQGEFLLQDAPAKGRWRILYDGNTELKPPTYSERTNSFKPGSRIKIKSQVRTMPDGLTRYRYKQWTGVSEPLGWDVEGFEVDDYESGALCVVPHNSDVTIHSIRVEPLTPLEQELFAKPGPGTIHYSAPVGGFFGARGKKIQEEFLHPDDQLRSLQVLLNQDSNLVIGMRFNVLRGDSTHIHHIGNQSGVWTKAFLVNPGKTLIGISGASGWYIDALRFHFSDGTMTPLYGGSGGDTEFKLIIKPEGTSRIRGFHGTFDHIGLETLGLIFDPAH